MLIKIPRVIKGPFKEWLSEFNPATWRELRRIVRNNKHEIAPGLVWFPHSIAGFKNYVDSWVGGRDNPRFFSRDPNLVVTEGINKILQDGLNGATYYIGLYGGAVDPASGWTGSNVVSNSTEITNYDESARQAWDDAAASGGAKGYTSESVFTATTDMTVNGAILISVNTKGVAGGTLINAVRKSSEATVEAGDPANIGWNVSLTDSA